MQRKKECEGETNVDELVCDGPQKCGWAEFRLVVISIVRRGAKLKDG